jgi:hypothetical protein
LDGGFVVTMGDFVEDSYELAFVCLCLFYFFGRVDIIKREGLYDINYFRWQREEVHRGFFDILVLSG